MLPTQKQEPHQPTATMTTTESDKNDNSKTTAATALTHRRRASHIEGRPRKRQYAQEFHPYNSSSGHGSRHKKHRSQPVNFLEDYLMNSVALSYTTSGSSIPSGNYANFLQENRVPSGIISQSPSIRQRSMSETTLQHGFLQDVTNGVTNTQDLSKAQINR